jgi:nicotinate-nucleotide adenylyltransferase
MAKSASNAVALLGGTFDPVHIGHLRIAIRLREAGFGRVIMIPNRTPPHRDHPGASAEQRLQMLTLATEHLEGIEVSDIELQREQPSYTADTVLLLRQQLPDTPLTWVMGNDAWNGLPRWHQPGTVLNNVNLLVISRPGESASTAGWLGTLISERRCVLSELLTLSHGGICHLQWPELDISASDLRAAIKRGDNIAFLTPPEVISYIDQHQLYR